jgi:transcriptional regulator with XRE-family HTH domain
MNKSGLAKRVKKLRARKGLSQDQLADLSGLSLRTIQRVENGETIPRGDTLRMLAIALQVSPDEIIDWQIIEDKNVLVMLNLSQLGFLAFPLLGIIIPLTIWILKKDTIRYVDEQGKSILNFQISWVMALFPCLFFGWFLIGPIGMFTITTIFYSFAAVLVILNTKRVYRERRVRYKPSFSFLK